jgi:hypothetical protein
MLAARTRLGRWITPRGGAGSYWMPSMPRIPDAYLDCVIYLYGSEADAEDGLKTGGSGFLVGIPTTDLQSNVVLLYAVTNKHVVEPGNLVIRLRTKNGKHAVIPTEPNAWSFHEEGDDLAVCLISFDWQSMQYNYVPINSFLTKEIIKKFNIGPGDEAFVVGRFVNHEGKQYNLPTARFGCVAQLPWEPVRQDTGFMQESFLVEARSIAGYSGAAVFVYIPEPSRRSDTEDWYPPDVAVQKFDQNEPWPVKLQKMQESTTAFLSKNWGYFMAHGPWLLGVDWGHINDWEPVRNERGQPVNRENPKDMQVKMNTGMMAVVPAWKLSELLDCDRVKQHRIGLIEQIREAQADNPAVSD